MAPNPPKKLSIAEQGGIRSYLEASRSKHKNLGADDLINRVELEVPWTKIAEDFNVRSTNTVKDWHQKLMIERFKEDA